MDVVELETLSSAFKVKEKEAGDVAKFLNRILGLSVERQNLVSTVLCMSSKQTFIINILAIMLPAIVKLQ